MSDIESPEQRKAMENFIAEYENTTTDKLNFQFLVCILSIFSKLYIFFL